MKIIVFNSKKKVSSRNAEAQAVDSIFNFIRNNGYECYLVNTQTHMIKETVNLTKGDMVFFTGGYGKLYFFVLLIPFFRIRGIKFIARYTGDYLRVFNFEKDFIRKLRAFVKYNILHYLLFVFVDVILSAGPRSKEYCKKVFFKRKVFFLPTPVDLQFASDRKERPFKNRILFVGGFEREKGFDIFMEVANAFVNDSKFIFTAVGFEEDSEFNDRKEIEEKGISVYPSVSKHDLSSFYDTHNILLFPSRISQGFGQVALEAISAGLKVITLNHHFLYSDVNWRYVNKSSDTIEFINLLKSNTVETDSLKFIDCQKFWNGRLNRIFLYLINENKP